MPLATRTVMSLGRCRASHQKIIILKESANDAKMFQHSSTDRQAKGREDKEIEEEKT